MQAKICNRCHIKKASTEYRKREGQKLQPYCFPCQKEYDRLYWLKTKEKRRLKRPENDRQIRKRNTFYILEYLKEHPCVDCGESDPVVLEFDHLKEKVESVSNLAKQRASLEKLKNEIRKCEVRCANCHRRKTAKERGWYQGAEMIKLC